MSEGNNYPGETRKILWVKVGGESHNLGDERTPGVTLEGIGVTYAPARVVELAWSDGLRDTILPCISDRITIRHEKHEPSLIEIPNLDTSNIVL